MRKEFLDRLLHPLRAESGISDLRIAAARLRADGWHAFFMAANVAAQLLILAMIRQRDAAVWAAGDESAAGTLQGGRVTAAVQEQNDLLFPFQTLGNRFLQPWRKDWNILPFAQRLAHIHHPNERHFLVIGAFRHFEQGILAPGGMVIALE